MSGVWGAVGLAIQNQGENVAQKMSARLRHRPWYQSPYFVDEVQGVVMGAIGIGLFNANSQVVWNADHTVAICFAGECYDVNGPIAEPEKLALDLYSQHGSLLAQRLKGAFCLVIWDTLRKRLTLTNDRFALYPLYYAWQDQSLIFAPEVKAVLAAPGIARRLDLVAFAQYMRFQEVLGERTFFETVRYLPGGNALVLDLQTGTLDQQRYWWYDQVPVAPEHLSFAEVVDETTRRLLLAVKRQLTGPLRTGLYLSGGLDSRTILAAWLLNASPPHTLSFGIPNSSDVYYAKQIAARARTSHRVVPYADGKWVAENADWHLTLTEGFHSFIHQHGINTLTLARQNFDINLSGLMGDSVLGGTNRSRRMTLIPDETAFAVEVFNYKSQDANWPGLTEAEARLLVASPAWPAIHDLAFDSLREEVKRFQDFEFNRRLEYFDLCAGDLRHFHCFSMFMRSTIEMRYPFLDYDFFDFVMSVSREFRLGRRLQIAVLNRLSPTLSQIPRDATDLPPLEYDRWLPLRRLAQRARRWLAPANKALYPLHCDYALWLRRDIRDWAEEILLGPRIQARGLFNPEFLNSLWARLLAGEYPMLGKIAPIMSYEMMLRAFVDET